MKPVVTEKAVMAIERENVLTFQTEMKKTKEELKKEIEELFDVKIQSIRTLIRNNKKYVFIKLKKEFPAIDVATKLGLI
jgi:large subunit ribosomal protein L23